MKGCLTSILISLLIASLSSCERVCDEEYIHQKPIYYSNSGYKGDVFYAEKLLGYWQCDYDLVIGGIELKEMKFVDYKHVDIIMCKEHSTDRWSETFEYRYKGNCITFTNSRWTFYLDIVGYLYPELYVQDSFGRYTIRKTRLL